MSIFRFGLASALILSSLGIAGAHAQSQATELADAENQKKGKSAEDAVIEAGDAKQDEEMRIQIKTAVWESQLGQMFADYINSGEAPSEINRKAHALVERMFGDITLTIPRSAAVQLMIEDLYEQDRVDKVVNDRINLFQSVLVDRRHQREAQTLKTLLRRTPWFLAYAALSSSPLVREQSVIAVKWASLKAANKVGLSEAKHEGTLRLRDFASTKIYKGADGKGSLSLYFTNTQNTFLKWFGLYSIYYYMVQSGSTDNVPIVGRVAIIGLEQNIRLRQL